MHGDVLRKTLTEAVKNLKIFQNSNPRNYYSYNSIRFLYKDEIYERLRTFRVILLQIRQFSIIYIIMH